MEAAAAWDGPCEFQLANWTTEEAVAGLLWSLRPSTYLVLAASKHMTLLQNGPVVPGGNSL